MRRVAVPLAVIVMGVLVWLLVAPDDVPPPAPPALEPDATAVAPKTALPSLAVAEEPVDAALPDGALTIEMIRRKGLTGRPVEWVDEMLRAYQWRPVDGEAYTWTGGNDVKLTFVVEGGRVLGAHALFPPTALSADVKALSGFIVGEHAAMPMHFEVDDPPEEPLVGEFEIEDGRKFFYRGSYRQDGEPPYGPTSVEVSVRPF